MLPLIVYKRYGYRLLGRLSFRNELFFRERNIINKFILKIWLKKKLIHLTAKNKFHMCV